MSGLAFIGSSGRTATTFIASVLNKIPGVLACHEGYIGSDKEQKPVIPLVNLENRQAYLSSRSADDTVANKRNIDLLSRVLLENKADSFIDIAYYNSVLACPLLKLHKQANFIGIVRDCASFVRSATTLHGEDMLPVGWAESEKTLSPREKFISLGRIVPHPDSREKEHWNDMTAIEKNIWLWRETNLALIAARDSYPDRVTLLRFERIYKNNGIEFFTRIADHLGLDQVATNQALCACDARFRNKKTGGYQVDEATHWTDREQQSLQEAVEKVETGLRDVE